MIESSCFKQYSPPLRIFQVKHSVLSSHTSTERYNRSLYCQSLSNLCLAVLSLLLLYSYWMQAELYHFELPTWKQVKQKRSGSSHFMSLMYQPFLFHFSLQSTWCLTPQQTLPLQCSFLHFRFHSINS